MAGGVKSIGHNKERRGEERSVVKKAEAEGRY
jgi:hypothetical protein